MPTARDAAAPCSTRGAAQATCSRSDFPRSRRIAWWRSTAARFWRPASTGAIETAWDIAEALARCAQAARHRGHRDRCRPRRRCARLGTAAAGATWPSSRRLAERRRLARLTRHGEIVAQRAAPTLRIGRAQRACCRRAPSCKRPRRARPSWRSWSKRIARAPHGRRPVLRRRPVRAAPCRARARHRRRQRCGRDRGVAAAQRRQRRASSRSRRSSATFSAAP